MAQMKARSLELLYLVLLMFFGVNSAHAQTAQEIAKKAFRSTVLLVMEDANGQPFSLGSGFFVRDGEIVSNLHVVEGAAKGYAKLVGQKTKYDLEGITAVDPERDLVVLKISARSQALPLGNSDAVQIGEPVYAVGSPEGLEGTFSQGIVSGIREVGTHKLLQITAPISPGSSGGPVLNGRGEVIGVSVATFRGGQNLNFAIPSSYLKTLLSKTGPAKALAQGKPVAESIPMRVAIACTDSSKCPYFYEVFNGDASFRNSVFRELKRAKIGRPSWFPNGVQGRTLPISIDGRLFLLGSVCEPHNCAYSSIDVLHDPQTQETVGMYTTADHKWFGRPTAIQKKVLLDLSVEDSDLYRQVQAPKIELPIVVK